MFHEKNGHIAALLPSLGAGVVRRATALDLVLHYIDEEVSRVRLDSVQKERLLHVKSQLIQEKSSEMPDDEHSHTCQGRRAQAVASLVVESEQTTLLALAFGALYTPALALFTGGQIAVQVWGAEVDRHPSDIIERYFTEGPANSAVTVFIEVAGKPSTPKLQEPEDPNSLLRVKAMLARAGYKLDLASFALKREVLASDNEQVKDKDGPHQAAWYGLSGDERVCVDLHRWFCSCRDFTKQSMVKHTKTQIEIMGEFKHTFWAKWLQNSRAKFPDKMPICMHLLAVVLMALNWDLAKECDLVRGAWVRNRHDVVSVAL